VPCNAGSIDRHRTTCILLCIILFSRLMFLSSALCNRSFSTGIVCTVMPISAIGLGIVLGVPKFRNKLKQRRVHSPPTSTCCCTTRCTRNPPQIKSQKRLQQIQNNSVLQYECANDQKHLDTSRCCRLHYDLLSNKSTTNRRSGV